MRTLTSFSLARNPTALTSQPLLGRSLLPTPQLEGLALGYLPQQEGAYQGGESTPSTGESTAPTALPPSQHANSQAPHAPQTPT
eukprot:1191213-Prorocentrum_minimum.AAC.5